jgi:hypothetical protein
MKDYTSTTHDTDSFLQTKNLNLDTDVTRIIACLVVLLNAGASPNFDEIEFEMAHEREGIQTAFGRLAYSTALHCLFGNICCLRPHTDSDALRPQADSDTTKEVKDMLQQWISNIPKIIEMSSSVNAIVIVGLHKYKHSTIIILSGYRPSHSMSGSASYFNKSENVFTSNPINRDMSKNA